MHRFGYNDSLYDWILYHGRVALIGNSNMRLCSGPKHQNGNCVIK